MNRYNSKLKEFIDDKKEKLEEYKQKQQALLEREAFLETL